MIPQFVLDCSAAMTLCFEDESTSDVDVFWDTHRKSRIVVPSLWFMEVANTLVVAERRKRITRQRADESIADLLDFEFDIDTEMSGPLSVSELPDIARKLGLTVYDAAYVELCERTGFPLCTLDKALAAAANKKKIKLVNMTTGALE